MKYTSFLAALIGIGAAGTANAAPTMMNGSFETPAVSSYVYTPTVTGVTFNAGSGVQQNGSAWKFADAPDGVQTAFIQSSYGYTGQIAFALSNLVAGQAYDVAFSAAARPDYANNALAVAVDGSLVGTYDVASTAWQSLTTSTFVATATTASLVFSGSATTNGDNDVGLDRVTISAVPEPASWGMMILGMGMVGFALRRRQTVSKGALSAA